MYKALPLKFTTSAYVNFSKDICELADFEKHIQAQSVSEQFVTMAKVIAALANGYVDYQNYGVGTDAKSERLQYHTLEEILATSTPLDLSDGMAACFAEIHDAMQVDTPKDVKLKERDYELEELEKQKKS
jgi:hypothetical protein